MLPVAFAIAAVLAAAPLPPLELSDGNLAHVEASIRPPESDVRFESIPWHRTLWSAALEAQRQDRPILLWAMNGHPLGCV